MSTDSTMQLNTFLTFQLGAELFSVNVGKVVEIIEVTNITKVPQSPDYMCGVINLRGSVLPVVDTRIKFEMPSVTGDLNTSIIVMEIDMGNNEIILVGALVDKVLDVMELGEDDIKPSPSLGSKYKSEFILGMGKFGEEFIMILDIDKVFSTDEVSMLADNFQDGKGR